MAERFAIYYAPSATGALWERASTWLGRDARTGEFLSGTVAGVDRNRLLDLTQSASRYGFHATLKAPMALAAGTTETELRQALTTFSAEHNSIALGTLRLAQMGGFLALVADENEALQDFAAHVVEAFEPFRAPLSVKDRAARLASGLTPRQEELLDGYGYPYVFEEFRFHMTLSDRLSDADAADLLSAAQTWFGPVLDEPVVLDRLALYHEPDTGKSFRRVADFPLGALAQ
jgi:putative phosphonate metabolism protein